MVFALNPNAQRTFEAFKATAMGASPNTTAPGAPGANGTGTAGGAGANTTTGVDNSSPVGAVMQSKFAMALVTIGVVAGLFL